MHIYANAILLQIQLKEQNVDGSSLFVIIIMSTIIIIIIIDISYNFANVFKHINICLMYFIIIYCILLMLL